MRAKDINLLPKAYTVMAYHEPYREYVGTVDRILFPGRHPWRLRPDDAVRLLNRDGRRVDGYAPR